MKKRKILLWLLFFPMACLLLFLPTAAPAQEVQINGFARNYTGVLLQEENEYSTLQNTLDLELTHKRETVSFKANPYVYHYADSLLEFGLRELYMDIHWDRVDLRVGKQQIIWGKADGVFITDIVSPKDLREFLLPDFDEIRLGVTAVKADYYLGDHTIELVWVPVFTATLLPEEGSIWRPRMDFPVDPVFDTSQQEITTSLQNSELFAKYSAITSAIDFEIMAGYAWDDEPTLHVEKQIDSDTGTLSGLTVIPTHHRLAIGGASFSSTLGAWVVRGEGAYYGGKYFTTADQTASGAVTKKDYLHYVIGVDYTLWDTNLSVQFIQQVILQYDKLIQQDEIEHTVTTLIRRDFFRETLAVEVFAYVGLNNKDALIRPRVSYDMDDGFQIMFGANFFLGSEGRFGQYKDNDMAYFKVKYSF